ncbi:MAG: hypothetical protein ACYDA8_21950, partial [Deferrisomatales bacterium]
RQRPKAPGELPAKDSRLAFLPAFLPALLHPLFEPLLEPFSHPDSFGARYVRHLILRVPV